MEKKRIDTFKWKILLVVVITIVASTALTYGFFVVNKRQTGQNEVVSGCFDVQLVDETASINLTNSYSMSDEEGKRTTPYSFGITNTCDIVASYYIVLDVKGGSFGSEHINVMVDGSDPIALNNYTLNTSYPAESGYSSSYILKRGTLAKGEKDTFEVRAWINEAATYEDVSGKSFEAQVRVVNVVKEVDDAMSPSGQTLASLGVKSKGVLDSFAEIAPKPTEYRDKNFIGGYYSNQNMTNYQTKYFTYANSYTFDTSTGLYTLTEPQVCQYQSCYETLKDKYIVGLSGSTTNTIATSSNLKAIYKVGTETTATKMPYFESSKTVTSYDYSKDGIYEMEDDYGTSYYYRGAVENNYVKFGKNKLGQDMYWRIVRINGDGSLRIIYDGTSAHANGEYSTDRLALTSVQWNTTNYNDAKYIGYMYGGANGEASTSKEQAQTNETDSNIKTQLDTWYKENIVDTGYSTSISDEIFCNDRSFESRNTGTGWGTSMTYYGARGRTGVLRGPVEPQFKCPEKNDSFTMNDTTKGNGMLEYPVGLITADEILAAGGKDGTNNSKYYLYKETWYWSLSPSFYHSYAVVFSVGSNGNLNSYSVPGAGAVVPVINLSAEYTRSLIGTGTMTDPYRSA